ncbi:MAG: trehalose 6-phosphatase [Nevskia sp.]|nr:trehalose 6-phosphatase [Nevskia sp.]
MDAQLKLPAATTALFLDFDGTLVDIAERPELVSVPDDLPELLQACAGRLQGALAIVSGRRLSDVDHFLHPLQLAGAGLHGAELRAVPQAAIEKTTAIDFDAAAAALRYELGDLQHELLIENKSAALAVHYRSHPQHGAAVERALRRAVESVSATLGDEVDIVAGKFVFEARARGVSKGSAVRALMACTPFAGRVPVFVGDDVTDEDGIRAAQAMGGFGVKVGDGVTAAVHRLRDPHALAAWLRRELGD